MRRINTFITINKTSKSEHFTCICVKMRIIDGMVDLIQLDYRIFYRVETSDLFDESEEGMVINRIF